MQIVYCSYRNKSFKVELIITKILQVLERRVEPPPDFQFRKSLAMVVGSILQFQKVTQGAASRKYEGFGRSTWPEVY